MRKTIFKEKYPEIWKYLDVEKNTQDYPNIDLDNFTVYIKEKLWWKCPKCGKSYKMMPWVRTRTKTGQYYCQECQKSNFKSTMRKFHENIAVNNNTTLKENYPDIYKQLDTELNSKEFPDIDFDSISYTSHLNVNWICPDCGSRYKLAIYSRIKNKFGCKYCFYKASKSIQLNVYGEKGKKVWYFIKR